MVIKARAVAPIDHKTNHLKSVFSNNLWAYVLAGLAVVFVPYNLFNEIKGLIESSSGC
jgi:hypothetical protein